MIRWLSHCLLVVSFLPLSADFIILVHGFTVTFVQLRREFSLFLYGFCMGVATVCLRP